MNIEAEKKEGEEDEFEIEVYDDTPEEDRGRGAPPEDDDPKPKAKAEEADDDDDDDDDPDLDEDGQRVKYSKNVQKRIKQLKYEFHQERRQREEAERLREEAIKWSEAQTAKMQALQEQMSRGETIMYSQAEGRVDAMIKTAQRELRDAYDAGDSEKIVESQTALANLVSEKQRLGSFKPRKSSPEQKATPQQQPQQQAQPKRQEPSPRAKDWAKDNEWFGKDNRMTAVAYAVHEDIIKGGVQPDSQEYYRQIDAEMRKTFPDRFSKPIADDDNTANVVAAPTRQGGKKPRNLVRLSKTQLSFCKRLGITPEQYAKEMLKQEKSNG